MIERSGAQHENRDGDDVPLGNWLMMALSETGLGYALSLESLFEKIEREELGQ
ncbi:MAG: hypothetical protein AAF674_18345 [Pseudomonadota bacterium]